MKSGCCDGCAQQILDAEWCFIYTINHTINPPQIENILICHDKCRFKVTTDGQILKNAVPLSLAAILTRTKNKLGFAEINSDPNSMLKFLRNNFGKPTSWSANAKSVHNDIITTLKNPTKLNVVNTFLNNKPAVQQQTPTPSTPDELTLVASIRTLMSLNSSLFNPALLPTTLKGYANVVISSHRIKSGARPYAINNNLTYDQHLIPERIARRIIKYGQEFIKAMESIHSIANTGKRSWAMKEVGNFLIYALNQPRTNPQNLHNLYSPIFIFWAKGLNLKALKAHIILSL